MSLWVSFGCTQSEISKVVVKEKSDIYYNERPRFWHGDIFVLPEWKALKYDWSPECFKFDNRLKCNRVIKNI